ncbi:MAG: hypothetical protein MZV65_32870 [Chromatiales bacterium]|nr:hypothetical protein [Chromatiales bacterium]
MACTTQCASPSTRSRPGLASSRTTQAGPESGRSRSQAGVGTGTSRAPIKTQLGRIDEASALRHSAW